MRLCRSLLLYLVCLAVGIQQSTAGQPPAGGKATRTDRHGNLLPPRAVARIGQVLRLRHGGAVAADEPASRLRAMALAADGKSVFVCNDSGILLRQRLPEGDGIYFLGSKEKPVLGFDLSRRGDVLVTRERNDIHVREAATGKWLREVATKGDPASFVLLSPDGRLLSWASDQLEVHLCDTQTGREVRQLKGHKLRVLNAAFSPDGRDLVTIGDERTIRIWDVATGQQRGGGFGESTFGTEKVFFSPDGSRMIFSAWRSIALWDTRNGGYSPLIFNCQGKLSALAFSPDGKTLACCDNQYAVVLWDMASGEAADVFQGHKTNVCAAQFSSDGKTLLSGSEGGTILV